jgi:branched-chain amino acid transport system substrate-binding protein
VFSSRSRRGGSRVVLASLATVAALAVAACGEDSSSGGSSSGSASKGGVIKIGAVAPFSGGFASSSTSNQNTWNEVIADVNAKGGINGRKLQLVVKDTKGQPNLAVQYTRELMDQGVKLFWVQTTADELAIRPLMNTGKILVFSNNPPDIQNDPKQFPYGFNFQASNKAGVQTVADAAKAQGHTKWAVVSDTTGEFQTYVNNLKPLVGPSGAKIVLDQKYDPTTTDFSSIVTKIKQSGADAIFFFAVGTPVQAMLTAVQAAGLKTPIFGGYGLVAADLSSFPDSVLEQAVAPMSKVTLLTPDGKPLYPDYGKLTERFYEKFGKKPSVGGGVNWDEAMAMVWAIEKAGGDDPAKIKQALESTEASGGLKAISPDVAYKFSGTDHGGYPDDAVGLATLKSSKEWPGYYYESTK